MGSNAVKFCFIVITGVIFIYFGAFQSIINGEIVGKLHTTVDVLKTHFGKQIVEFSNNTGRFWYRNYTFISDTTATASARLSTRYSDASLRGVVKDIHFLSQCDFLVCTFSSNVGRAAYELMQTLHGDASQYAKSIDRIHFFNGQNEHYVEAVDMHKAQIKTKQIELQPKDLVKFRDDF